MSFKMRIHNICIGQEVSLKHGGCDTSVYGIIDGQVGRGEGLAAS